MMKRNGLFPVVLNWKCVPTGSERLAPGATFTIRSRFPSRRHTWPVPSKKYQTSSTVLCATAMDTSPGFSVQWTMLPRLVADSSRISEPSGASVS